MVVPKSWLADIRALISSSSNQCINKEKPAVEILAFEAAATMSRIICIYRSLLSSEVQILRSETMRSQGVAYLNSTDQFFLLCTACAEFMTELDCAAAAVARMGLKCTAVIPHGFDRLYNEIKACGVSSSELQHLGLGSGSKSVEKKMKRMERYVASTLKLYEELEVLNDLEAKERKQWRQYSGPIPMQKLAETTVPTMSPSDAVNTQLRAQNLKVKRLKDESLWNKSYDRVVELMARAVVTVFERICVVFSPAVPGLPDAKKHGYSKCKINYNIATQHFSSGPLERRAKAKEVAIIRNSAPIYIAKAAITNTLLRKWDKLLEAPPNTLGASGLALWYANVIVLAEKLLRMRSSVEFAEDEKAAAREELYTMIPMTMRSVLKSKLSKCWTTEREAMDRPLAEGWQETVERILEWLGPVAHDTLRWHEERNMDPRQRFDSRPRALLLQTLHFSDEVKTEAAIIQVLVGLSCVYWYAEQCRETSP